MSRKCRRRFARSRLVGRQVPKRGLPDFVLRLMSRLDPALKNNAEPGAKTSLHIGKGATNVGLAAAAAAATVVDCAASLIERRREPQRALRS